MLYIFLSCVELLLFIKFNEKFWFCYMFTPYGVKFCSFFAYPSYPEGGILINNLPAGAKIDNNIPSQSLNSNCYL